LPKSRRYVKGYAQSAITETKKAQLRIETDQQPDETIESWHEEQTADFCRPFVFSVVGTWARLLKHRYPKGFDRRHGRCDMGKVVEDVAARIPSGSSARCPAHKR
jgi:hypothetical protein